MSRYRCNECEAERTTENMVAICAWCSDDKDKKLAAANATIRELREKWLRFCDVVDDFDEAITIANDSAIPRSESKETK